MILFKVTFSPSLSSYSIGVSTVLFVVDDVFEKLGEQEKKHQQLSSFSKSVSSLQAKAREQKYQARLGKMESRTMTMMLVTGGASLLLLLISIFSMMSF